MGLYSEMEINPPLYCPYCGEKHSSTQTYAIYRDMKYYKVGSEAKKVEGITNKRYLIIKDELICFGKGHDKNRAEAFGREECRVTSPSGEKYVSYDAPPLFCYMCFDGGVYKGTVLSRDDAEMLLDYPEEEHLEYYSAY